MAAMDDHEVRIQLLDVADHGILRLPRIIQAGVGARASIPNLIAELGTRIFIVVDPFLATTEYFIELKDALEAAGLTTAIYTEVLPELPADSLTEAASVAAAFAPDVVLGYGGGSALDAAKLVALLLSYPGPLSTYYGENAIPGPVVPLVAVPTTAGTGSEVTPVAVISDPERELKVGVSSPHLVPTIAIVDPELSMAAPSRVAAYSGIDAFVHSVESYTAVQVPANWSTTLPVFIGRNVLTDPYSLEAARRIGRSLDRAVNDENDREARVDMAYGSLLAGVAFGSTGTHLSHALQYPIGALTHTPHGLGTGMMLPHVLRACMPQIAPRLADIADALGVGNRQDSAQDRAQAAIEFIDQLTRDIGLPRSLREIGITHDQLPRIAELAAGVKRLVGIAPAPEGSIQPFLEQILEAAY